MMIITMIAVYHNHCRVVVGLMTPEFTRLTVNSGHCPKNGNCEDYFSYFCTIVQDKVWGIAYRIEEKDKDLVIQQLDFREKNGYTKVNITFYPVNLVAKTEGKPFSLVIYLGDKSNEHYAGEADMDTIARQIAGASGPSGSNREYLYNLAQAMRTLAPGQDDHHLFALEDAVRKLDSGSSLIHR